MTTQEMIRSSESPTVPASWSTAGIADARAFRIDDAPIVHTPALLMSRIVIGWCGIVGAATEVQEGEHSADWADAFPDCVGCVAKTSTPTIVTSVSANGFGIWHAEVAQTGVGDHRKAQRAARRAILAAIIERSPRGTSERDIRIRVALMSRDSRNGVLTSYFAESVSS